MAGKSQTFHAATSSQTCPLKHGRDIKERINKWDFIKIKSFCMAEEKSSKIKRVPTVWENILANNIPDKSLISKIYRTHTTPFQEDKQLN